MKHYGVMFLPKDIWVTSFEQGMRYLPANGNFDGDYASEQEALNAIEANTHGKNALVYTLEHENTALFDETTSLGKVCFVPKNPDFEKQDLCKELRCYMDKMAKQQGFTIDTYPEHSPYGWETLHLYYQLSSQTQDLMDKDDNTVLNNLARHPDRAKVYDKLVEMFQKHNALLFNQRSFSYDFQDQHHFGFFEKKRAFMQAFSKLSFAIEKLVPGVSGHKVTPLEVNLYAFLCAVDRMERDARVASIKTYYNTLRSSSFPQNYLGILPTLTEAMELVAAHLNIDEAGIILKNGLYKEAYQQGIANLKSKTLQLQSPSSITFEYLSYLMFAISACALGLTLASVIPPIGIAVVAGGLLAGVGLFKVAESDPGRQMKVAMEGLPSALERYVPGTLSGH